MLKVKLLTRGAEEMHHLYFLCGMKTAWTSSLFPSRHGSNSACRAVLTTFSAKPAACSFVRSKMYLFHNEHTKCNVNMTAALQLSLPFWIYRWRCVANTKESRKAKHVHLWLKEHRHSTLVTMVTKHENPHFASSTTSTASGAAICRIVGPSRCTQL